MQVVCSGIDSESQRTLPGTNSSYDPPLTDTAASDDHSVSAAFVPSTIAQSPSPVFSMSSSIFVISPWATSSQELFGDTLLSSECAKTNTSSSAGTSTKRTLASQRVETTSSKRFHLITHQETSLHVIDDHRSYCPWRLAQGTSELVAADVICCQRTLVYLAGNCACVRCSISLLQM